MNDDELTQLEQLAVAATPGPWTYEIQGYTGKDWLIGTFVTGNDTDDGNDYRVNITTDHLHGSQLTHGGARADAEFIAAARQAVPALVAEVRELQRQNREAGEMCDEALAANEGLSAEVRRLRLALELADTAIRNADPLGVRYPETIAVVDAALNGGEQ